MPNGWIKLSQRYDEENMQIKTSELLSNRK